MKKKESSALVNAVLLSNCIANDVYDDIFLHDTLMQRKEKKLSAIELDELALFDKSEQESEVSSKQESEVETSIFNSNKTRKNDITSTFLIDCVIAMSLKKSMQYKRKLNLAYVAEYCIDLSVLDKYSHDTKNLSSKLQSRISKHIVDNATYRKKSVLYKQAVIQKNEIIFSDKIRKLVCNDFSCMF